MSWFKKLSRKKFDKPTTVVDPSQSTQSLPLKASGNLRSSLPFPDTHSSRPIPKPTSVLNPTTTVLKPGSATERDDSISLPTMPPSSISLPAIEVSNSSSRSLPENEVTADAGGIVDVAEGIKTASSTSTSVRGAPEAPLTISPSQTDLAPTSTHLSSLMNVESSTFSSRGDLTLSNVTNIYSERPAAVSERQRKIADWLSPLNYPAIQKDTYQKVVRGTGQWLIHSPMFENWISRNTGTLWGTGIPGAGKTHLASIVVHHLQEFITANSSDTSRPAAVVYAYCRYNDQLSTTQVLASVLKQLVEDSEAAAAKVENTLHSRCVKKQTTYTLDELLTTLQDVLSLFPKTFIVVDALDEIRQDDVRYDLVKTLLTLNRHLFLTSRDIPLEGIIEPDFKIRAPSKDFQLFITRELERFPKINSLLEKKPEVLVEITQAIESKSDGMFLLSALQLAALRGVTSIKNLRCAISQLPTTLADMYHLTVNRIKDQNEEEASLALRAILWVTHARRSMEIDALLMALSIDPESNELDLEALTNESTLVSACFGLVTVEVENRTVRLVHFTAQDFFAAYRIGIFQAPHAHIAEACATYLRISGHDWADLDKNYKFDKFARSRPLCDYACWNLGHHIAEILAMASNTSHLVAFLPITILSFLHGRPSLLLQMGADQFDHLHVGTAIHFAACHGLISLIDQLSGDVNTFSSSGYTPLYYACRRGHISMIARLLSGFSIGVNDSVASDKQMTPLHVAALHGHDSTVQLLLATANIDINGLDEYEWTALHFASRGGDGSIVEQLLATPGIDVNKKGLWARTDLHEASRQGHISVVQQLLSFSGIEINAQDKYGCTALHLACQNGYKEVVHLLLESPGIDANVRTTKNYISIFSDSHYPAGSTALDIATKKDDQDIVAMFKERGYDSDTSTLSDARPL